MVRNRIGVIADVLRHGIARSGEICTGQVAAVPAGPRCAGNARF
jgi:hypothetical protein